MRKRATKNAYDGTQRQLSLYEAVRLTIEIGVMSPATDGFATAIPPTALVTDTAGVKTPSAIVRLVPNKLYAGRGKHGIQ